MTGRGFISAVKLYWRTAAVVGAVVLIAAVTAIVLTPSKFTSSVRLMVSISGETTANAYQNDTVVTGRVDSYVALLTTEAVAQRVAGDLRPSPSVNDLLANVSAVRVPPNTALIDLAVTADSPEEAQRVANAYAQGFIAYTSALETPTGEDAQRVVVRVVTPATTPRGNVIERVGLAILAVLLALLAALAAVWIRAATDPVVRSASRARDTAGAPLVGFVVDTDAPDAQAVDGYRRLRTALHPDSGSEAQVVAVVAAGTGFTDSRVASLLAGVHVHGGATAVVVDTAPQPRRDMTPVPGVEVIALTDEIEGDVDLMGLGAEVDRLFGRLRSEFTHVIIAVPSVLSGTAATALAQHADTVVLATVPQFTTRRQLRRIADDLTQTGAAPLGVVVVTPGSPSRVSVEDVAEQAPDESTPDGETPDGQTEDRNGSDPHEGNP